MPGVTDDPNLIHRVGVEIRNYPAATSLLVTNSSSAAGLPLPVDHLVMRAQSIKVTLAHGMDAMAEFAMQANPNLVHFHCFRMRCSPPGNTGADARLHWMAITPRVVYAAPSPKPPRAFSPINSINNNSSLLARSSYASPS